MQNEHESEKLEATEMNESKLNLQSAKKEKYKDNTSKADTM